MNGTAICIRNWHKGLVIFRCLTASVQNGSLPGFPAASQPATDAVDRMVDGVGATLRVARSLLQSGRQVDVEGLDRIIGVLCARALDLPPEQGRNIRPRLAILLRELDALGVAMQPQ